jgi:hypothetical protein
MSIRTGVGTTSTIRVIVVVSGEVPLALCEPVRILRVRARCVAVLGVGSAAAIGVAAGGRMPAEACVWRGLRSVPNARRATLGA